MKPLADLMRPQKIEDVVGQTHLLQGNGIINQMVLSGKLSNLILWGPPGSGKTTIAKALANSIDMDFVPMSAIFSGTADIKKTMDIARSNNNLNRNTLLFIDEIHRFNKSQQDTLLPYLEDGTVVFIGATTENPSFNLNNALLSRCHVATLKSLSSEDLSILLNRAETFLDKKLPLSDEAKTLLIQMSDGDARFLLNTIEYLSTAKFQKKLSTNDLIEVIQKRPPMSDKSGDEHYNLISAVHKSLRASDTDAALYWTARMMTSGQDPKYILRRLTRFAMEDIGLADPEALHLALSTWQAYERLGSPEGDIALTELVVYLSTAPKSISCYKAHKDSYNLAEATGSTVPPKNILNAPTKTMQNLGYGQGYIYDPETASGCSGQNCFPENMKRTTLYTPIERGFEREIKKRLDYWNAFRKN